MTHEEGGGGEKCFENFNEPLRRSINGVFGAAGGFSVTRQIDGQGVKG